MAHHKRGCTKNQRAGCLACKPQKMMGVKKRQQGVGAVAGPHPGRLLQEAKGHLNLSEQVEEHAQGWTCGCCGGDGSSKGCIWCGLPCPEGEHVWGPSDLEGIGWRRCTRCFADDYVDVPHVEDDEDDSEVVE